ncbi:protein GAMETE CELL DEFECTIVE 1, mitochondrial isoform X1 [Salvia miltiorrhiza]|uniref:protein GAMETE CELL DEFECTIVE 1, mitochondrial isoform X1 n=1 Tax=Salvia miltiorrhiza TaxID=226208 RepID=UPI0025AD8835|nr:protein GAMETE CELL DEFECTIVE 1, mitochondrial isoform X1 [Salvia miltiorrhiza]
MMMRRLASVVKTHNLNPNTAAVRPLSTKRTSKTGEEEWNDAWETAWLPDDLSGKSSRAPWESDVSFSLPAAAENPQTAISSPPEEIDTETKAFVEDMNDNWDQRKGKSAKKDSDRNAESSSTSSQSSSLYSLENIKRDYRLTKQKIHASLWAKEIEKQEEAKLGNFVSGADDIEKLLDSASEIFDSAPGNPKIGGSEFKNKPDGWETTSKNPDGNVWDMSQREEDILVQEFERRIAFNKFQVGTIQMPIYFFFVCVVISFQLPLNGFQIASFIKQHIFSRRRPVDGWKYMIEVIGPNAKKGKGSVARIPSVSDESTQPYREDKVPFAGTYPSQKRR